MNASEFSKHLPAVKLPCETNHVSFRVRGKDFNRFPLLNFAASFRFQTKACTFPNLASSMSHLGMRKWTQARQKDIQDAYNDTGSWTELDEITRSHDYSFRSIAECGRLSCLQAHRDGGFAAWQLASSLQLGSYQRRAWCVCNSGCINV